MDQKINMADFKNAKRTVETIMGVTTAIKKIDLAVLGQCPVKAQKVNDFIDFLDAIVSEAEVVVSQAKNQFEARPVDLVNAAVSRVCAIPQDIFLDEKTIQNLIERHKMQIEVLEKQGFDDKQAKAISPYPQAEIDEHTANVAALKVELKNLEEFLSDPLLCDEKLLDGAKLEPYLQHQQQNHQA
ncbi:MAG: hypothetical protein Q8L79_05125 [Methylobacter sp.]|uniref:hypothetical protein n=1 Tax=Methylobacter sp. TaxID=2051955 RepID=UPI0027311DA7|nr:hypothetical protein [Methylobacter sp.]MDP1664492.1 hypothetical protein [Methylobacter sp.]